MLFRRALLLALALAAILIAGPAGAAGVGRPVVERRLANGLRVVVSPDPTGVEVSVLVRYDTGSRDEPGGLEGVAHLLEHVMFLGSRHVAPGAFARLLDQVGATGVNGVTTTRTIPAMTRLSHASSGIFPTGVMSGPMAHDCL